MAILQVRDIDDRIYDQLKKNAGKNRRSISQEVIHIIETYLSEPQKDRKNSTQEFLNLSGSWGDDRKPEEIILEMKSNRTSNRRFGKENVIFD